MRVAISREQLIRRIRDAGWEFERRGKHNELYRRPGRPERVSLPFKQSYVEDVVRFALRDAGLTQTQIDEFWAQAVKR